MISALKPILAELIFLVGLLVLYLIYLTTGRKLHEELKGKNLFTKLLLSVFAGVGSVAAWDYLFSPDLDYEIELRIREALEKERGSPAIVDASKTEETPSDLVQDGYAREPEVAEPLEESPIKNPEEDNRDSSALQKDSSGEVVGLLQNETEQTGLSGTEPAAPILQDVKPVPEDEIDVPDESSIVGRWTYRSTCVDRRNYPNGKEPSGFLEVSSANGSVWEGLAEIDGRSGKFVARNIGRSFTADVILSGHLLNLWGIREENSRVIKGKNSDFC